MTLPHLEHLYPSTGDEELAFYVSGPMRGLPDCNFPAFDRARDFLIASGHRVVSPADHDRQVDALVETRPGFAEGVSPTPFEDLIGWDLRVIASPEIDAILFLPGWEKSKGAGYERTVAEACGKRFFYFDGESMFEERPTRLIGLAGYAQSGKDTVGEILVAHGFERIGFADTLKAVLEDVDPLIHYNADASLVDRLSAYLSTPGYGGAWEDAKVHTNAREYLQRLGVAVREHVDPDAWVNAALRNVKPGGSYVITDVRFPNEYDEIKRRGGEVWRLYRPGTEPVNGHVSETALDDHEYDLCIANDGTIPDLARTVTLAI